MKQTSNARDADALRQSPEEGLGRRLHILRLLVTRTLEDGIAKQALPGITFQQLEVLNYLTSRALAKSNRRSVLVGDVAAHLNASLPSASRIVSRLERTGLVRVQIASGDKRRRSVRLTAAGEQAVRGQESPTEKLMHSLLEANDQGTTQRWKETLDEIIEAMLAATSGETIPCLRCAGHTDGSCILRRLDRVDGLTCRGMR